MTENLRVRASGDRLLARLTMRAARRGRSAEAGFDDLAAELRGLTGSRRQTPSEELQREGREER